ncbi:MAG: hypothetical protein HBSAPP02_10580 [Phycisphaerae bacterium]|nr:MAG: hypothetical protein DCC66_10440 [Planctomycetota bacterium]GJQ26026.1 MAG: hypothetical protein HBSAPP02_10580 [Phycisphaerae bacterium]
MKIRPWTRMVAFAAAATLTIAIAAFCLVDASPGAAGSKPAQVLCPLDSVEWFNTERPVSWQTLRGRPVLLEVWATWCFVCLKQVPKLNALQRKYADRGLVVIGVTDESAERAYAYIKRYQMEYVVCTNQKHVGVRALPTTILIDGNGTEVLREVGEISTRRLESALSKMPKLGEKSLIQLGAMVGFVPNRPASAKGFDEAALNIEIDHFIEQIEAGKVDEVERGIKHIMSFYQANLPAGGWPGDSQCRLFLMGALFDLLTPMKARNLNAGISLLGDELLDTFDLTEPDWEVRAEKARKVGKVLRPGNSRAINVLSQAERTETHPLVRYALMESLSRLDKTRPPVIRPPSKWEIASKKHAVASRKWTTRWFGASGEYKAFDDYVRDMEARMTTADMEVLLSKLMSDYAVHSGMSELDLLVRYFILDQLSAIPYSRTVTESDRCRIQKWLLSLLRHHEPDWRIRLHLLLTLDYWKFDCLAMPELIYVLDERMRSEDVRYVRAYFETFRMELSSK